jgi:hypothetical protein
VSKTHYLDEYNHVACNSRKIEATTKDARFVNCNKCLDKLHGINRPAWVEFLQAPVIPRGIYIVAVIMLVAGTFDGWPGKVAYILGLLVLVCTLWNEPKR